MLSIEARQDRDPQDEYVTGCGSAGAKHRFATRGVNREDRRTKRHSFRDGVLCCVRYVVNLQIEKDALAAADDLAHNGRSVRDECLQPDLENANRSVELIDQREDFVPGREVDGDDESITCLHGDHDKTACTGPLLRISRYQVNMDKQIVGRALDEIAKYLELSEPNPFKARAFERAARAVESLQDDIADVVRRNELLSTPGIGKATGAVIEELVTTGRSSYLVDLRAQYPPGIFELLRVPGLGLKKIGILHSEFGIASLDDLQAAANAGRIAKLRGFGPKTQQKILEGIEVARRHTSQFLLPTGLQIGEEIRERLAAIDSISDAEVSGGVRRRLETVSHVDVVVVAEDAASAIAAIRKRQVLDRLEEVDETTWRGAGRDEIEVVLHLAKPADFGTAMLVTTGNSEFVEAFSGKIRKGGYEFRGSALFHNGRHVGTATEHDLFERVGIPYIDPERRETDEIPKSKPRARLIETGDLKGTFHVHTTFSDGRNTVQEMLGAAVGRGFDYVGISDHSQNAYYARGLTLDDLRKQHAEIDAQRGRVAPMHVFRGTEADILDDGRMDYGPQILALFDFVVASVHSRFGLDHEAMTERILRALDDPFVTILGHLTGRLLLVRKGYSIDFDRIFDRAAERGVMIEINGNPNRVELDWRLIHRAVDRGVLLCINPDAHSVNELSYVISGTWVARKGGLSPRQIFNTRPLGEVAEYLAKRRKRAIAQTR